MSERPNRKFEAVKAETARVRAVRVLVDVRGKPEKRKLAPKKPRNRSAPAVLFLSAKPHPTKTQISFVSDRLLQSSQPSPNQKHGPKQVVRENIEGVFPLPSEKARQLIDDSAIKR